MLSSKVIIGITSGICLGLGSGLVINAIKSKKRIGRLEEVVDSIDTDLTNLTKATKDSIDRIDMNTNDIEENTTWVSKNNAVLRKKFKKEYL